MDNLLEAQLINADGQLVIARENETLVTNDDKTVTQTDNGDLLWAIRGGGGGVWGVIINYTFRLHKQPKGMVKSTHSFTLISNDTFPGKETLKTLFRKLKQLPPEWGGYILLSNYRTKQSPPGEWGSIHLFLNHFGDWDSPSRAKIDDLAKYTGIQEMTNKTSFWDYIKGSTSESFGSQNMKYRTYIANGFLQSNETDFDNWVDAMSGVLLKNRNHVGCSGTLLGGECCRV